jgi:hypothetical protein
VPLVFATVVVGTTAVLHTFGFAWLGGKNTNCQLFGLPGSSWCNLLSVIGWHFSNCAASLFQLGISSVHSFVRAHYSRVQLHQRKLRQSTASLNNSTSASAEFCSNPHRPLPSNCNAASNFCIITLESQPRDVNSPVKLEVSFSLPFMAASRSVSRNPCNCNQVLCA